MTISKVRRMNISIWAFLALVLSNSACSKNKTEPINPIDDSLAYAYNWNKLANSLQQTLQTTYLAPNGKYYMQDNAGNQTFHYWHNAHVVDVLADAYKRTKEQTYLERIDRLLVGMREINPVNPGTYINDFYDDMGWLGLSTLRAYNFSKDDDQLQIVKTLWQEILTGMNDIEGRSLAWAKHRRHFKNTPANGPAIILGLRLARATNDSKYRDTAVMLYNWLRSTLVNPLTGMVWDGISPPDKGGLEKAVYTYNQGLFIGAAVEMYQDTREAKYLEDAVKTAKNAMRSNQVSPAGILKAEGQGDGGLFKGIFVRYFTLLLQNPDLEQNDRRLLYNFLLKNAQTMNTQGMSNQNGLINYDWTRRPSGTIDLSTQLSGMMLVEAMASLKDE